MTMVPKAIILAAGEGRRFQQNHDVDSHCDKLLTSLPGQLSSILEMAVTNILAANVDVYVVVQPHHAERKALLSQLPVTIVESKRACGGMGYALSDGVKACQSANGWLIALGDMPWIDAALVKQMIHQLVDSTQIIIPTYNAKKGHPVLFGAQYQEALTGLEGDQGAKSILQDHLADMTMIEWSDGSIFQDIDTPSDLLRKC